MSLYCLRLVRLRIACRFRPKVAQEIMREAIKAKLAGQQYSPDEASKWSRELSDDIRDRLKGSRLLSCSQYRAVRCSAVRCSPVRLCRGVVDVDDMMAFGARERESECVCTRSYTCLSSSTVSFTLPFALAAALPLRCAYARHGVDAVQVCGARAAQ